MKQSNTSVTRIVEILRYAIGVAGWLFPASPFPTQAQTWSSPHLGGYLTVSYTGVANTYNAGYSMYVALLGRTQYAYYSPNFQASFQIGTWMTPQCSPGIYCDIEGGPGVGGGYGNHWCNHGFGIGAVAGNGFTNFANGVSSGRGVGVYGAAQISPRLLYPPRLEMFRNGSKGQLVGYGYLALPLLPGKATTDGVNVPTGDRWWTLFFNTRNFQGPVAVLTPHFYSEVTKANPSAAGKMLDSCWAGPNKSIANESHTVPGREYDGPEGSFLRVAPVFSAINHGTNGSIALNSPTAYDQTALWNAVQQWLTHNGPAPVGPFNARGAALQTLAGGSFSWGIYDSPLGSVPLATGTTMGFYNADSATWGFKWGTNQVSYTQFADGTPAAVMPEYYQLQAGKWIPVSAATVPSQLASVTFDSGSPPATPGAYSVPSDPVWTNPGPAAGPFQARIEDGNVVTYYWFRFADQPAIMKAGLTPAEREQLQANVVKIHSAWTNGGTYLAPPTMGTLADVDPALLVTPPPGLEVGYVPVASNEFWGGWVTPTWNQATSGNWSAASNWVSASAPEAGGHSYYRLTFSPPGSCVATNDLSNGYGYGGFAVNQLNFSGAVTLTGNPITLTADVGSYPQINQNSTNAVVINTPLKLDVSTTLGGTGSGLVVISNPISGPWHSLTINSPATWRICGLTPNTYSGGTIIKRGTLIWGAITKGVSPDCSYALGSGPVTLHSGATLQFEKVSPTNALTLNGGTLYAANSAGATWMGPVTVNSNTTVCTDYEMGISGNISGARGLTKTGINTLTLSGVNTYTGANMVQAGTLSCSTPDSLGAGALSISNGATVDLNYSGTRSILSLTVGGVNKLAGVYGSSNSPATCQDARFSGTGTVTVPVPLSIANLPPTGIATNQATLNANLGLNLAYGGTNTTVLAYWGTVNGGTNPAAWANSAYVGKWTHVLSTNIAYTATGLAMNTNTTYYFAFLATNAVYSVWATNVLSFTTSTKMAFTSVPVYPPAGYPFSVTVQAQDADGNPQAVTSATMVQLSKSSGSGTMSGTVSGTIVNGSSSVVISGATYSMADTTTLTATAVSGMSLTAAVSPPIAFMPPDLTWDANGTGAGVRDGGGVWINATHTWWNGTTNLNWADHYNARIGSGGSGGTITLDTLTANRVTFTNFSGTYTLTGGTLNVMSNLTVANSAGSVVLTYLIGGPGGVTMNSSGSLRLYGLSPNTYSGGTIINRGTLIWGTMVNGISPDCNYALGTGPVTLNSGATLQFEKVSPTNALILNGGTLYSANGWGVTWNGPVTVNSNTTLRGDYSMEFRGNISGTGGFTKTSGNTVTLSGSNTYTGASVVQSGALSCSKSASLGSGALSISNGAVVNLNYNGTRNITALMLGGTNMALGVYGSTNSSAAHKDPHFTGTGTVTVKNDNEPPSSCMLTMDRIFDSSEFKERGLGEYKWSQRTASYFTLEAPQAGGKGRDLVRNDDASGHKEIVVPASAFLPEGENEPLNVESFEFSTDESKVLLYTNSKRVWRRNTRGDYWVLDLATRQVRKLGGKAAPATLMFAKFSPDGTRVAYVRENNIYVQELRKMKVTALTKDGSPTLINGASDWVNEEELSIRDAFRWSPDGRSIAFWQFDTSGVRQFHLINNSADTYPKITSFPYPKVGETNSATRLGVISATGGRARWLDIPGDPRNHYIPHAEWSPDGKRLLVQQFNRLQNTNRVMLADAKTGAIQTVLTETDAAWLENENPVLWVEGGSRFLWLSERDGWRHAYSAGTDGQQFARITGGDFDVIQVEAVDEKNGWLYFSASPDNPTQHYLYRARLGGGTPERLSPAAQPGWHTYDFSPDGQWAMHTYSTIINPPVVELVHFPGHKVVRVLADNQKLREKLATLKLPTAELLKVDIGDGVSLDALCLKPPGLNPSEKYPLLIHVYGEPASQSVSDRWAGGSGLWHWMLAQQGYIVASIENRGTPVPLGRTWRKMAFRQVGILAAQDQAAGVRALLKIWPYADAGRVGVWGWSGGGSMSLNAIFRYPDLYSTAMAVAPNASQLLYDTIYQERYMGLPQDNAENYRLGSPITHASQLKGNLLLVHGTGDDNGHYQGTERLMNELIAHHKHFTVMPYPNRTHAISEGPNTTRHFYSLLTRYLNEHLPVNPVRVVFETELGAITMDTDVARAPVTAANFLRYVDGKFYDGGTINRAVRPDNTIRHDVEIQVIQFQSDPARAREMFQPIPMERTSVTGLRNVNGSLSMARNGPETAQASFSIVIGDQPEMDFGGKRNPDDQGFAVFGRVVDGWDVVKKIHQSRTGTDGDYKTETLDPPIKILKAYRKWQPKAQIHAPAETRDKAANGGIQRELRNIVSDSDER